MGKQVEFKLKEINTKESIDKTTEEEEEMKSFKYTNELNGIEIRVKGVENANALKLPTESLNDSILVEFGPKQVQQKIDDDSKIFGDDTSDEDAKDEESTAREDLESKKKKRRKRKN